MTSEDDLADSGRANGPRKRAKVGKSASELGTASCSRCREKKIKCDTANPICRGCLKAGSSCVIIDSATKKTYTRSQIVELEDQIRSLEQQLRSRGVQLEQHAAAQRDNPIADRRAQVHISDKRSPGNIPRFIGDESGTGFIQYILHAIRRGWKNTPFTQQGHEALFEPLITEHPAHPLPSVSEGAQLVAEYLGDFHVQHTLLEKREVMKLYEKVYQRHPSLGQSTAVGSPSEKRELFHLNLIFALANVGLYRKGKSDKHPFGYFTAGIQNLDGVMSFETIQDIQGFLLIARFGMYYYIGIPSSQNHDLPLTMEGCSIWEICQICLRICIELGLHKRPRRPCRNLLEEQMRRRVFWECYELDRFSSITLGRPFGIEDSDIEIDLPFDAEDEYLERLIHWPADEMRPPAGVSSSNGEVAVFNCCLRLGRITCRIHRSLHSAESSDGRNTSGHAASYQNSLFESGDTYQLFRDFYAELLSWRISCPVFLEPQCPAQSQEWFQFLVDREKLTLIQAVIDCVHSRTAFPPRELLNPCHNTAVAVISDYDNLRKQGQVTYSWSYLQLMLSCGLSVIFCVFVKIDQRKEEATRERSWLSHRWTDLEPESFRDFTLQESSAAIDACAEVHSWMGEQAKEMARYSQFFNMMRTRIQEKIKQVQGTAVTVSSLDHLQMPPPAYGSETISMNGTVPTNESGFRDQQDSTNLQMYQHPGFDGQNLGDQGMCPEFTGGQVNDWSADPLNTFEPLVRQLFGNEEGFNLEDIDIFNATQGISPFDFSQEPLLAEFTSGLEGFM